MFLRFQFQSAERKGFELILSLAIRKENKVSICLNNNTLQKQSTIVFN